MGWQEVSQGAGVLAVVVSVANTVWVWLRTGASKIGDVRAEMQAGFKEVNEDTEDHGRRIQAIESELKHLPSKDDVAELKLSLTEMKGQLGTLDSELGSVTRTVRRIEDHLLGEKA